MVPLGFRLRISVISSKRRTRLSFLRLGQVLCVILMYHFFLVIELIKMAAIMMVPPIKQHIKVLTGPVIMNAPTQAIADMQMVNRTLPIKANTSQRHSVSLGSLTICQIRNAPMVVMKLIKNSSSRAKSPPAFVTLTITNTEHFTTI